MARRKRGSRPSAASSKQATPPRLAEPMLHDLDDGSGLHELVLHSGCCSIRDISIGMDGDSGSHRLKEISGASNNCWWRSAWVAAICHHAHQQPDELAKAVAHCVLSNSAADDATRQGIEMLRLMACSVRDLGVESIFTRGSASGDWQQRQHPSDLMHPPAHCCLPPPERDMEAAVDVDQRNAAASACEAQARHTAESIAAVTALVLRQKGVDEATIADAVYGGGTGDEELLVHVMDAAQAPLWLLSKPWLQQGVVDWQAASIRAFAPLPSIPPVLLPSGSLPGDYAAAVAAAVAARTLLVHCSSHFNLLIPDSMFRLPRETAPALEVGAAATAGDEAASAPSSDELSSIALLRLLQMGFDEDRARPAIEEALKPRTRKGKTLPNKMDLEQLVGRAMELALAVPTDAAPAEAQSSIAAAAAVASSDGDYSAGNAAPDPDDEGWITVGTLRAQKAAAAKGGGGGTGASAAVALPAAPSQAEILFSTDISTGLPAAGPAPPLDTAAAAAAAAELLDMGFDSDHVQAALAACGGSGIEAAVAWLMDNRH